MLSLITNLWLCTKKFDWLSEFILAHNAEALLCAVFPLLKSIKVLPD